MTPEKLHRVIELTAELEELMGCHTTFLYGDNGDDIRGILLADQEVTDDILGPAVDTEAMN